MGIFDKLFNNSKTFPQNEMWPHISSLIANGLGDVRSKFYDGCTAAITEFSKRGDLNITTNTYSDDVQGVNIRVFQLILSSFLIGKKQYIPERQGKAFADLLWGQVLGTHLIPAVTHGKSLFQKGDAFPRLLTFFGYVVEDATGTRNPNPAQAMFLLSCFGNTLVEHSYRTVANAFSDSDIEGTVRKEMIIVDNQIKSVSKRFDSAIEKITDSR